MKSLNLSKLLLLVLIGMITGKRDASAACGFLLDALTEAMGNYRSYKAENQERQNRLTQTEAECKTKGSSISERASSLAKAPSCTAQKEVSSLNSEVSQLGLSCEASFNELKLLQTAMHSRFVVLQNDLLAAQKILKGDALIKKYCQSEIVTTGTMIEAYLNLEGNILSVREHSAGGEIDYQKMKTTGSELAALTDKLNENCGASAVSAENALSESGRNSVAAGSGSVTGQHPVQASDLTGTQQAIDNQAKSENIIQQNK